VRGVRPARRRAVALRRTTAAGLAAAGLLAGCGGGDGERGEAQGHTPAPSTAAASRAAPAPRLRGTRPCPAADGFACSTLAVAFDRRGSDRRVLRLAVAVQHVARAPRGVLVVLSGGPGQPGVPLAERAVARLGAAAAGYRLVLVDQRGTGARALRCPRLQAAMGMSDLTVPPPSAVTDCARRLGPGRVHFTTADTVADLDDVRRALGARRLTLAGTSYGTFVAARYALAHPARVGRLVLDSVVPHDGVDGVDPASLRATARVLRAVCRAERCGSDPAGDLAAVVRRDGDGPALLDMLVALSVGEPSFRNLAQALGSARAGDRSALDRMMAAVRRVQRAPASVLSQGLHAATLCAESRFPWAPDQPVARRRAALARARDALRPRETFPFDAATAAGNGFVRTCLPWPPAPRERPVPGRLPRVPALLLAGDRDLSTPVEWAREQLARTPRGRLVVAPGAGHGVLRQVGEGPVRRALVRFLQAPR
jgi:pimeloyl-ACP methyl ester carboxylesterase